ncbi:type II toxin-antitoxin system VapC family toxin [soil metagenome]
MFVLDTNVVSELRRAARASPAVLTWAHSASAATLFISAITVLELERGVMLLERRDALQGAVLRAWLDGQVLPAFEGRVLAVDTPVARRCAALHVPNPRPERDGLIGATALEHGFTLVTRNVGDFQIPGLKLINPWENTK